MTASPKASWPWRVFGAEFIGTALLVLVGLSLVIFMFGVGSPVVQWVPSAGVRRAITGFLFGATGASIAVSAVGKISGAHINPVVTIVFWLFRKLDGRLVAGYIGAQLLGAIVGALPLLLWGEMGRSVQFGATVPGAGDSPLAALLGEVVTTFLMVALLINFLAFRRLRPWTPLLFPPLYGLLVYAEAPLSGTSTNPARSLGPAVISGQWASAWIYWAGPLIGALAACVVCSFLATRIEVAKLYHFEHDRDGIFRKRPYLR